MAHAAWGASTAVHLHRRAILRATALQVVATATGWGFALPVVHVVGLGEVVRTGGARAVRIVLGWAGVAVLTGQVLAAQGVVGAALPAERTHAIAAVGFGVVVLAGHLLLQSAARQQEAFTELHNTADRFRGMIEDATDLVILVTDERVEYASPSTARLFGCRLEDLVGRQLVDLIHHADREQAGVSLAAGGNALVRNQRLVEMRMRERGETWFVLEGSARALLPGPDGSNRSVLNLRDITERRRLEHELAHRASHDAVSGLANRGLFRIRTQQAIRKPVSGVTTALTLVELGGLDRLQTSMGQRASDAAIREVATRISDSIGESDLAARLGDHSIAVLSHHSADTRGCPELATVILDSASSAIELPEGLVRPTATAGCTTVLPERSVDQLLAEAEVALEEARARGLVLLAFDPSRHARALTIRKLEHELTDGLERREFVVHYQPLVDLGNQEVLGFEALVRWQHPERGLVSPGDFIPAAERSGAIVPLGRWILREACDALARLQRAFPRATPLYVTVNVAAAQLASPSLRDDVRAAIDESGIEPGTLTIEITEGSLIDHVDQAVTALESLRAMGCRIAIDDFGTGYSSLSQLQQFPLDILKVDRAFIHGLRDGDGNSAVTEAIVSLGRRLELRTVAEGIETGDDLDTVMGLACNIGQGYFFGRPAAEEHAVATLQQRRADLELAARLSLQVAAGADRLGTGADA